ncbi:unnamed protein product [Fusarium graminearum]|uniref:Nudix hydrolase domain-containing protein n=1 Tax=Gibberella zeae TaxID=5518 RepID=A0A9N8RMU7_GIBZA|nr:unnamed protein product [Fusarium graminearum]
MGETLLQTVREGNTTSPQKYYHEPVRVVSPWAKDVLNEDQNILNMDRSGLDPFGVISLSAHMIGFVKDGSSMKYWVSKRSSTKPTVPNKLDSTVAGVIRSGEQPIECMLRKICTEASIPAEYIEENIVSCGTISYQMHITSTGNPGCQHIISYLYEMEFKEGVVPRPGNDEVGGFTLMTQEEVMAALTDGDFVANRAMVWLAYFIRHGTLTPENEPDFLEISQGLNKKHDMFIVEDLCT